jgi:hypothetical protein
VKTTTCSGIEVTEFDLDVDTEDITIQPLDADAERWEALADAYADGTHCSACPWDERGFNIYTQRQWRECHCPSPDQCIAIAPKAVANAYRRQAT